MGAVFLDGAVFLILLFPTFMRITFNGFLSKLYRTLDHRCNTLLLVAF